MKYRTEQIISINTGIKHFFFIFMAGSGSKVFMNLESCISEKSWDRMQGRVSGSLCKMLERDRVVYSQDGTSIYLFTVCSLKHYRQRYEPTHMESGRGGWLTACQAAQGTHLSRLRVLYHPGKHHCVFSLWISVAEDEDAGTRFIKITLF